MDQIWRGSMSTHIIFEESCFIIGFWLHQGCLIRYCLCYTLLYLVFEFCSYCLGGKSRVKEVGSPGFMFGTNILGTLICNELAWLECCSLMGLAVLKLIRRTHAVLWTLWYFNDLVLGKFRHLWWSCLYREKAWILFFKKTPSRTRSFSKQILRID